MHKLSARPLSRFDRRAGDRRSVAGKSTLRGPGNEPIDVTVGDLSVSGFNIESVIPLPIGATVQLGLPGSGRFEARVVRREGDRYGCEFVDYLSDADVDAAFSSGNVAQLFVPSPDWQGTEPEVEKWPRAVRASVAVGGALAIWGAILAFVLS